MLVHGTTSGPSEDSSRNLGPNKRPYINSIVNQETDLGSYELSDLLSTLDVDCLQKLWESLESVFTKHIDNSWRQRIVEYFLRCDKLEWRTLVQQICFIMPPGNIGHDVYWVTEMLVSHSESRREKLVNVANRLFTSNTKTIEKLYVLKALCGKGDQELDEIDAFGKDAREKFVAEQQPPPFDAEAHKSQWISKIQADLDNRWKKI